MKHHTITCSKIFDRLVFNMFGGSSVAQEEIRVKQKNNT